MRFRNSCPRVVVVGPTYLDHTIRVSGDLSMDGSRHITFERREPGGTGLSYAVALSRLGNFVDFHSVIGTDDGALAIQKFVDKEINLRAKWQTINEAVDYAIVLLDEGSHKVVASRRVISDRWEPDDNFRRSLIRASALVISSISNDVAANIFPLLEQLPKKPFVLWAPHQRNCENAKVILNHLALVDHISLSGEEERIMYKAIGDPLLKGVKSMTITHGKSGCDLWTRESKKHFDCLSLIDKPVDTNGAGEAFGSGFLTGLLCSQNYETSVRIGMQLAGLHVQRQGNDFPVLDLPPNLCGYATS